MARTVTIRSDADFVAFAAEANDPMQTTVVEFTIDKLTLPFPALNFRNRMGVEFRGETAPGGVLTIAGGSFNLVNCGGITVRSVAFRLKRPVGRPPEKYEKSWKSIRVHSEHPQLPSTRIRFDQCSFSGHTDELEVGPADHDVWFRDWIDKPACVGITFDRCIFGPSLMGRMALREKHNFNLSLANVNDATMTGCLFVASNRRNPQVAGSNFRMEHCAIFDWGTMGTGFHAGSSGSINACHYVRGVHTVGREMAISLVEGTADSPRGKLGPVVLSISPNTTEYAGIGWRSTRTGWSLWAEPSATQGVTWRRAGITQLPLMPLNAIIAAAGAGDSIDVAIRRELTAQRHVPWRFD